MNWLQFAWAAMASALLTLGLVHLFIWWKQRSQYAHLLFFAMTASIAAVAVFELMMMRATTAAGYATTLRWAHVPVSAVILSMVGFVYFYFDAGRVWLGYAVCVLRLLVLGLNFATGVNINFQSITALDHVTYWGNAGFAYPVGTPNPWWVVSNVANLLLVAFLWDASITLWRRGVPVARRRALLVGGGLTVTVVLVVTVTELTFTGHVRAPTILTPTFLIVVLAMGYELGEDTFRAAKLSRDLRNSERRSELAAQAAGLALWSWDTTNNDFWLNSIGRGLFGFAEGEHADFSGFLGRVHAEDRLMVHGVLEEAAREGKPFEWKYRISAPASPTRWVVTRGQVEQDRPGDPLVRGVTVDITERVRAEQEAAVQRNELAHLSRVASLGEMAGSLAHEINQPLMAILSNAQAAQRFMAGENCDLAEVRAILADVVADDKRAGEIIYRLRALLRKGEVQRVPLEINNVVEDVIGLTRNELLNRGVVASSELAPDLPCLHGDRIQLQQVVLNLIVNACDAMEGLSGSHQLTVRTRAVDGAAVELSVSDSGCGIPAADLERIFEPFVSTKKDGMGLGLSVCRTIVAAHGGRLWAESLGGRGATLRFTLPVAGSSK